MGIPYCDLKETRKLKLYVNRSLHLEQSISETFREQQYMERVGRCVGGGKIGPDKRACPMTG